MKNKVCEICGSDKYVFKSVITQQYLCNKHRTQLNTKGKIKRTRYDANEIILKDNYAIMKIYNINGKEIAETLIDINDVEKIKLYKWALSGGRIKYVTSINNDHQLLLHRLIMNANDNQMVDHINHNTLDNRKSNLRLSNNITNHQNMKIRSNNTSGVPGVGWSKKYNKWRSRIKVNKKEIHLGYFDDFNEAVKVRKEAEQKYFGEYSYDKSIAISKKVNTL